MFFLLLVLFVIGPIAEIAVLLGAADAFGIIPVIATCLATAAIGGWLLRLQGLQAMNAARRDLSEGKPPVASAVDGALLVAAAPFLMTPGFLTDAAGFALLIPPVRRWLGRLAFEAIKKRMAAGSERVIIIDRDPL